MDLSRLSLNDRSHEINLLKSKLAQKLIEKGKLLSEQDPKVNQISDKNSTNYLEYSELFDDLSFHSGKTQKKKSIKLIDQPTLKPD